MAFQQYGGIPGIIAVTSAGSIKQCFKTNPFFIVALHVGHMGQCIGPCKITIAIRQ